MSSVLWWIITIALYLIFAIIYGVGMRRGRANSRLLIPAGLFYVAIVPWLNLAFQPKHGSILLLASTWFLSAGGFVLAILTVLLTNRLEVLPRWRLRRLTVLLWFIFVGGASGVMAGFANTYYYISAVNNAAFSQVLSKIDAAYVTIGTLSTAGTGNIYAISGGAKLTLIAQTSIDIIVFIIVLGFISTRLLTPRSWNKSASSQGQPEEVASDGGPEAGRQSGRKVSAKGASPSAGVGLPRNRTQRGRSVTLRREFPLTETALGTVTELELETAERCLACGATGNASREMPTTCQACRGSGRIDPAKMGSSPCAECEGFGTVIQDPCPDCGGDGRVPLNRKIKFRVPAGVEHGTYIMFEGEGEAGPLGGPTGDVFLEVIELEDPRFERRKDDLYGSITIPKPMATVGGTVEVETLQGRKTFDVPAKTKTGTLIRVKGEGVPRLRTEDEKTTHEVSSERGDLMIRIIVNDDTEPPRFFRQRRNSPEARLNSCRSYPVFDQDPGLASRSISD